MINLGLTGEQKIAFENALTSSHRIRSRLRILNQKEKVVHDLNHLPFRLIEGSVQIDSESEIRRKLDVTGIDLSGRLSFDPTAPEDRSLFMTNIIKASHEVWVEELGQWVLVPIFTGPITQLTQKGSMISIEAMGKEVFSLAPSLIWNHALFPKGTKIIDVIKYLLESAGEKYYNVPELTNVLQEDFFVTKIDERWKLIKLLADGIGYSVFFNGDGLFQMRQDEEAEQWVFDTEKDVLSTPTVPYDFSTVRNVVRASATINDKPETARSRADPLDPISPEQLAKNGHNRFLIEMMDFENVLDKAALIAEADKALANLKQVTSSVTLDCLPIPHLEENDWCGLREPGKAQVGFRIKTMTIPMTVASMSVGYLKRYDVNRRTR